MRLLFYKSDLAWPRVSGHDVHAYQMMRALVARGHQVSLATLRQPSESALAGLSLSRSCSLVDLEPSMASTRPLTSLQERFRSYWGIDHTLIAALAQEVIACDADALIAVGLDALPFLAAAPGACRVWYAADEWFIHHASLFKISEPATWGTLRHGAIKLLYERAFASMTDRAWVVSERDRLAMSRLAGMRAVDVIPNGVDTDHFRRPEVAAMPHSCVFWGRLDFEPNLQGLQWFVQAVWPKVRARIPDATLDILGANPGPAALQFGRHPGVTIHADLPDLRPHIASRAIAVLPFVSGGGIKNKLLEAASMEMPIVCTPRACGGLRNTAPPFISSDSPEVWVNELIRLWQDDSGRARLGAEARAWVIDHHTWDAAARDATAALSQSLTAQSGRTDPSRSPKEHA